MEYSAVAGRPAVVAVVELDSEFELELELELLPEPLAVGACQATLAALTARCC